MHLVCVVIKRIFFKESINQEMSNFFFSLKQTLKNYDHFITVYLIIYLIVYLI